MRDRRAHRRTPLPNIRGHIASQTVQVGECKQADGQKDPTQHIISSVLARDESLRLTGPISGHIETHFWGAKKTYFLSLVTGFNENY